MVAQRVRGSPVIGVAFGFVLAIVGWWATFVASETLAESSGSLFQSAEYPLPPRLVLLAVAIASGASLLRFRRVAVAASVVSVAGLAYGILIYAIPDRSTIAWLTSLPVFLISLGPEVRPGEGFASSDPVGGSLRDLGFAILNGGTYGPIIILTAAWTAVAIWRWLPRVPSGETDAGWRSPASLVLTLMGPMLVIGSLWLLPAVGRAMTQMFVEGRSGFSILPTLALFSSTLASSLLILRWPPVAAGAVVTALVLLLVSVIVGDPERSTVRTGGWSLSFDDLGVLLRVAYAPVALVLSAAWIALATARLRPRHPRRAAEPGQAA
jgi:hypothetical protein